MSNRKLPVVAIVGRTNAGKSSIFNRLVGRQDAIVAFEAGTTRDSIYRRIDNKQGSYILIDTAGLKDDPRDEFEASIQDQVDDAVASADLILLMKDSTEDATQDDRELAKRILRSGKPVILVLNKIDLSNHFPVENYLRLGIKDVVQTSAEHNRGLDHLSSEIMARVPHVSPKSVDDKIKVALIGRPNAGKSYLFNTLAGKQQAVVANVAGTTRDINRVEVKYHGKAIELLDTAGVRRSGKIEKGIERFSVLRTASAIDEADICLLLMDVNELNTALDAKLAGQIIEAGKGLIIVVSKWDSVIGKDAYTRDALAPSISRTFDFAPWAPLIFTSSTTGQNVSKIYDLIMSIQAERQRTISTSQLNDCMRRAIMKHKPAGLKNTHPRLRYVVQTDVSPPWFVIYGSNLKFVHWSYKRYLEGQFRDNFGFNGTPIKFSFRDEKQIKANRERQAAGKDAIDKKKGELKKPKF
ncbi:MAG: ribosome biogenesis GTPase Der [Candidatus Saccharibacteria bacterium]|nr:ribosome biogenesis GTPase Der [Candidatus Saccharibacteria bacterium]